jgi:hypothetical protein
VEIPLRAIPAAQIAWYVTGRFYATSDGTLADFGYFLHLGGLPGLFAAGVTNEAHAHFTFAAAPFSPPKIANGDLRLSLDPAGEFSVYLQRQPQGTFNDPQSFARGERIATFRRVGLVVTTTVERGSGAKPAALFATNAFSAQLIDSQPFEFGGRHCDLRALLPHGVTQFGTAAETPMSDVPKGYAVVLPFTGSAVAIGAG